VLPRFGLDIEKALRIDAAAIAQLAPPTRDAIIGVNDDGEVPEVVALSASYRSPATVYANDEPIGTALIEHYAVLLLAPDPLAQILAGIDRVLTLNPTLARQVAELMEGARAQIADDDLMSVDVDHESGVGKCLALCASGLHPCELAEGHAGDHNPADKCRAGA